MRIVCSAPKDRVIADRPVPIEHCRRNFAGSLWYSDLLAIELSGPVNFAFDVCEHQTANRLGLKETGASKEQRAGKSPHHEVTLCGLFIEVSVQLVSKSYQVGSTPSEHHFPNNVTVALMIFHVECRRPETAIIREPKNADHKVGHSINSLKACNSMHAILTTLRDRGSRYLNS